MPNSVVNYDGSITASPAQLVFPESVADLQAVLRDPHQFPSPVRAVGSYHSLTPCASSDGTMINMSRMNRVLNIDAAAGTITAQAGIQFIDASKELRKHDLQFMTNIEIGNMTLGSAACCHTKDALDGIEFGQVNSYLTSVKWVTPSGDLAEASEEHSPELLRMLRGSYGLAGVVYEVTFRIKPIEAIHLTYLPRPVEELTQEEVDHLMDSSEGLICWTVGRTAVFQQRTRVEDRNIFGGLLAAFRRRLWNRSGAYAGHLLESFVENDDVRDRLQKGLFHLDEFMYGTLRLFGGITILAPDKTIDYSRTKTEAKYAFTFWAFPRSRWLSVLRDYLDFADAHHQQTGFRCNMPLGAYHIRRDTHSVLSYSHDEEVFSIDPIHAPVDLPAWHNFLRAFNEFSFQRGGIPLLNQSPFVERRHVEAAYGQRWRELSDWVAQQDPAGRMLNPYFAALLSKSAAQSQP
ncbi:FAD-binding protein [Paludibaculum fermentans]|uniref:FAD-binding protein n=1 Tax=Paludibaculum fermentans TaxID=1473598 RepID=UPI003EBEE5A8